MRRPHRREQHLEPADRELLESGAAADPAGGGLQSNANAEQEGQAPAAELGAPIAAGILRKVDPLSEHNLPTVTSEGLPSPLCERGSMVCQKQRLS